MLLPKGDQLVSEHIESNGYISNCHNIETEVYADVGKRAKMSAGGAVENFAASCQHASTAYTWLPMIYAKTGSPYFAVSRTTLRLHSHAALHCPPIKRRASLLGRRTLRPSNMPYRVYRTKERMAADIPLAGQRDRLVFHYVSSLSNASQYPHRWLRVEDDIVGQRMTSVWNWKHKSNVCIHIQLEYTYSNCHSRLQYTHTRQTKGGNHTTP